ncbi:hypothetical protein DFH07DRAFT_958877 [Mycena maculata]|uniref:DUF1772-domain-containing protein n=1 Tax=Mycena maculata TaxID=230809 RepID=A0AAD7J8F2_9AGAR|nr:hypothetical protein DFH07DRAFT_958877 [Mycena maculata]
MPATARGATNLPTVDRLVLWEYQYNVAKVHMAGTSALSSASLTVAAYFALRPALYNILVAGALAAFTNVAWSILFLVPINKDFLARIRASRLKPLDPAEDTHVLGQLDRWRAMHCPHIVLGLIAWLSATTALLASDPIVQL